MIAPEVREIDGTNFKVVGLDLRTERAVLLRLTKTLGPVVAELVKGSESAVPEALGKLLNGLDEADVDFLIETFRKVSTVRMETADGGEQWLPCTDTSFKAGVSSQIKWLWFCLEHQYAAFLGSGSGKLDAMLERLRAAKTASR